MMRFENKVVVITGAGSGIGEATAKRFSQEGAIVVLVGRNVDKLNRVYSELSSSHARVIQADVSDQDSVKMMIDETIEHFGKIDILVNNAGLYIPSTILDTSLDDGKKVLATNLDGVIYCSHFALPHLLKSKGCIVNNASVSGIRADWGNAYYCTAKGAVVNLTRAMALDHGSQGIRVNAVCPSLIITPMTEYMSDDVLQKFDSRIPMKRAGTPAEVASAIAFLASEDASFINGVNLPVDGGVTASNGQPNFS
ncbi:SDR family NAD(P)-dependent oxidoreductase [Xenorhabdus bovienii]|uniref:Oxidoreductase n=1 Tax=Xenorhabdus bovienii TaxID=40576 RepID=A0A0B6X7Q8_XENBV|nr:SDR family NAD(P)-dependent oxidoreductase [Xenorhabdus bovienii]MCG3461653.1 SDR family oxidoreductase [Xenorhabdus bovienii]CDG89038.1 Oxidoreductase [Xenorhabdus bovienii str. feltiae France]CDG91859.1 Oxidoreductase [Xenorhabdus bovienii str. feltiae Florida]CDM89942.1 Oxidoreductase [Xenorhabdus bovienii]